MKELLVDKGQTREIAIVEKAKYYIFKNVSGNKFVIPGAIFEIDEIKDDITESQRRYILKNKYIEKWRLAELDEEHNIISSTDGREDQKPIDDNELLKVLKNEKKLKSFLNDLTVDRKHILDVMKKLCIDHNCSTNAFLALQEKIKELKDKEFNIL